MPHRILDVVAKDPEEEQIAAEVQQAAVKKHGRDQGQVDIVQWCERRQVAPRQQLTRDNPRGLHQAVERRFARSHQFVGHKDVDAGQDEQDVDNRQAPAAAGHIADWNHG